MLFICCSSSSEQTFSLSILIVYSKQSCNNSPVALSISLLIIGGTYYALFTRGKKLDFCINLYISDGIEFEVNNLSPGLREFAMIQLAKIQ